MVNRPQRMKKKLLAGAVVVVAVLLIAPLLLPASLFVPRIEKAASEVFHDRVQIGGARVAFLPAPHLTLRDISVGSRPYLEIAKLSLTPRLRSAFANRKALRLVELSGVTIRQPLFAKLEALAESPAGGEDLEVERIILHQADLKLPEITLESFQADVRLGPGNRPVSVLVQNADRSLRMTALPKGRDYAVVVQASGWRLPAGPPLHIAQLKAEGELNAAGVRLPTVSGQFYGGPFAGQFALTWAPEWQIAGHFDLSGVELQPIAAVYSNETAISGRLAAKGLIDMKAANPAALAQATNVEVDFDVVDGTLHRMDLAAAASLLPGKTEGKPGQTRFDRFSGHLTVDPQGFHFTDLKIASGVLNAQGFVSISPTQELSGRIDTALKGTGSLVGTPLAVSGTVDAPKVRPTKGTLAGAAAGTLLLGPGVGTTIGMKAAELTERLFGQKPPKPRRATAPVPKSGEAAPTSKTPSPSSPSSPDSVPGEVSVPGRR
jgi:hypothetical protein